MCLASAVERDRLDRAIRLAVNATASGDILDRSVATVLLDSTAVTARNVPVTFVGLLLAVNVKTLASARRSSKEKLVESAWMDILG